MPRPAGYRWIRTTTTQSAFGNTFSPALAVQHNAWYPPDVHGNLLGSENHLEKAYGLVRAQKDHLKNNVYLSGHQAEALTLPCQHGADRTGVMSAMYRMVEQGWSKQEALDEMINGGYGFHPLWSNIIDYIKQVDIA
ncbi:MAG TPA: hypothetical protein VFM46_08265, partial [Pseudomonadales bacterium]|nr:hypothetical protein [Pseudomonadales bacterium]